MKLLQLLNMGARRAGTGRPSSFLHARTGTAAIEFALVAPIFALVFVASVDLGMVVFSRFQQVPAMP
jgi:Flp pilus assembly protein TadG